MGNNLSGFNPGYYIWRDPPVYNEKPVIGPGFKDTKGKHFPPGARIPDWKSVTLKDAPELEANQRKLAALGLKDNWARNEVWRFNRKLWGTPADRTLMMFVSFKYGFAAFLVTVALCETVFKDPHAHHHESIYLKDGKGHGHSDAHEHYHVANDKYKLLYQLKATH